MKTINKTLVAAICSLSVIICSNPAPSDNQLTQKEKKDGWQLLFNGKSIEGWHVVDGCLTIESATTQTGCMDLVLNIRLLMIL